MTIDIDNLTIKQLREIRALAECIGGATHPSSSAPTKCSADPWVGRYVLIRTYSAGVHTGILASHNGDQVELRESRRLWGWTAAEGVALSGVAKHGLRSGNTRVDVVLDEIRLVGVIEVIPCTADAEESIRSWAVGK